MSKNHYLYRLLVFTKNVIFKKLITITLFLIFIKLLFSSSNGVYPEPVYYEIDFGDGVTHLWSREIYYDQIGFDKINKAVTKKYDNIENDSLTFYWAKFNYLDTRDALHDRTNNKIDSIFAY